MKKIKIGLTVIVMLFAIGSFAMGPEKVSPVVKAAFENDFSKASQVTWEKTNDFYFASFTLGNLSVDAAYNESGELVGTSRKITTEQMPLSISLAIAQNYDGYLVDKSVTELTFNAVTRYYVTISNEKQTLKLKCFSNGDMEVESKTKR